MITNPVMVRAAYDSISVVGVSESVPHQNTGAAVNQYLACVGLEPGEPWCAAFVYFRMLRAASELKTAIPDAVLAIENKGAAVSWYQYAKSRGLLILASSDNEPARGDLCLFEIDGGIHHVGFVLSYAANIVRTVEGNTHPQGVPSRDGYGIFARSRNRSEFGTSGGFARLGF